MQTELIALRNHHLSATLAPAQGGRVVSLVSRHTGTEFLTQALGPVRALQPGLLARFEQGPCAGMEECLPTVAACGPATEGGAAPDHGDFWQLAWTVDEAGPRTARMHADGFSRTLRLSKHVRVVGAALCTTYCVRNTGTVPQSFVYAAHPLFAVEAGDRVLLPPEVGSVSLDFSLGERLGVRGERLPWPGANELDCVREQSAGTAEMLYTERLAEGRCGLLRARTRELLLMEFPVAAQPYLGVWLCHGGWPGGSGPQQYAVALEPTTAAANSLATALAQGQATHLAPGAQLTWELKLTLTTPERAGLPDAWRGRMAAGHKGAPAG